jgi:Tol biopolymer transport system component
MGGTGGGWDLGAMRWLPRRTNGTAKGALLVSLIAGLGSPAVTGQATASATFPGKNGRIAVVVTDPKDVSRPTNVMTMAPDGSHRRLITRTAAGRGGGPTNVAFSADGRRMVFDRRVCGDTCHSNVGVMSANGSHMRLLTRRRHGSDTNFGFSPNGRWVGFTRDGDIFVVRARGGRPKRLTRYGIGTIAVSVSFSPDGESVVFDKFEARYRDGAGDFGDTICVVSIAGRDETCLGEGSSPLFAPNGQAIVFTEANGSGISKMRPDGSGRTRLISGSRMRPLAFSPDGARFAFLRDEGDERRKLFIAKPDGTRGRAITGDREDFEANFDMAFSPDARNVIYRRGWRKPLYASRIDGSRTKRIPVTPKRVAVPSGSVAWAPRAS